MNETLSLPEAWIRSDQEVSDKAGPFKFNPLAKDFFLPIANGFSSDLPSDKKGFLLKDGLAPLLWFLLRHKSQKKIFYVHSSFASFIPEELSKNILYYALESNPKKAKETLILGHYYQGLTDLIIWKKLLKSKATKAKFSVTFQGPGPIQENDHRWWNFYDEHLSSIRKEHVQIINHSLNPDEFVGHKLINLNDRLLVALDYLEWKAIVNGASVQKTKGMTVLERYPLSVHATLLLGQRSVACCLSKEEIETIKLFTSPKHATLNIQFHHYVNFLVRKYAKNYP